MSFVQRLRMANMFPIKSDLGNARIDTGSDDMYAAIEAGKDLALWNRNVLNRQPYGMRMVSDGMRGPTQPAQEPLKFGGVFNSGSNPGADILARSKQNGQTSVAGQPPQNQMIERGISPDEAHMSRYFDRKNKEKTIDATLGQNERKIANEERRLDQADTRINISDAATDRRLNVLESGNQLRQDTAANKQLEAENLKKQNENLIKSKAQEALDVLDQLSEEQSDKSEKLKPDTETATGYSANTPFLEKIPFGPGTSAASANARIDRLRNMLTLDLIKEMKAQSKTGATGFGQMNLRELGVLEDAATKLDKRNMREEEYAKELGRIRKKLNQILQPSTNQSTNTDTQQTAPQAPEGFEYVRRPDNKGWTAVRKLGK